jgi:ubiquinone/menaquinone biosynthesis C-methylase UbiE
LYSGKAMDINVYDAIAPFYDAEHARFNEDLDMYQNYAELCGGRILELACGSGRVLLPLAQAGYELTGVDSSEAMLQLARQTLTDAGVIQHCTLVRQDIRKLQLEQKFRLGFIALGSFAHLTLRQEQREALTAARAHLSRGATFILDISNADARYMEDLSGQVLHQGSWQQEDGTMLTHFVSPASAHNRHLLELTHFYERHQQGGPVQRTVITTHLALFERGEIELLLEQTGFVVKEVYGNYELEPFHLESPRMICISEAR